MRHARPFLHALLIVVLGLFPLTCVHSSEPATVIEQTLCTTDGTKTVMVALDHGDHAHDEDHDSRCPWCTSSASDGPVDSVTNSPTPVELGISTFDHPGTVDSKYHLPLARGPPQSFLFLK